MIEKIKKRLEELKTLHESKMQVYNQLKSEYELRGVEIIEIESKIQELSELIREEEIVDKKVNQKYHDKTN